MAHFGSMYIFLMTASAIAANKKGETYQYFLDILDTLDPEWVYDSYENIGTKIKCASLCFQDVGLCHYFGFHNKSCYLMDKNVKRDECSKDNCTETGMKIYKLVADEAAPSNEEFACEPPKGAKAELFCPENDRLIRAMGSRSPFFGDVLGNLCSDMKEQIYSDEEEVLTFLSLDGGFTLNAQCPDEYQVIQKFSMCVMDMHVQAITLHCKFIKEEIRDRIEDHLNVTSDDMKHTLVECPNKSAVQKIYYMNSGNDIHTRVVFHCVKIYIEEDNNEPDTAAAKDAVKTADDVAG